MLPLAFLNPLLLWGLFLCAVPILIHLLNRRRFRRVPWGAMEFLLRAMQRNKKRLRMEQWLVLLLRTLAVLLLVVLVGRPQLGDGLFGERTHHVVVLDDSASMGQRSGSTTLYGRAQDRIRALVDDLVRTRQGDAFSLVRSSRPAAPELWNQRVGPELARRVTGLLVELAGTDAAPDLGVALQSARQRARSVEDAARIWLYVVGDRRAVDWATDDEQPRPGIAEALRSLDRDRDRLLVLGSAGSPANLGIVELRLLDRMAVVGVPLALAIDVQNFGLDAAPPTTIAIEVDGQSRVAVAVPRLLPGERVAVPLSRVFHQPGPHRIDAALEPTDSYPIDDRRTLALDVREKSRVLLVDGQPDEDDGETFFLQAAMEVAGSGIEPQVVGDAALVDVDLAQFDMVWLCNVQSPSASVAARLEDYVAAGGGLAVFAGPLLDVARWNELLWRDGQSVLPLPFGDLGGDPDRPVKAVLVHPDHAICAGVGEVCDLLFGSVVLAKRWLQLVEPPGHAASVIARLQDAEGPPLLASRSHGRGEVVQCALAADKSWSNLPSTDLFLVLVNQVHRAGARRQDIAWQNLLADGELRLSLDPAVHRGEATVRSLQGDEERTFTTVTGAGALLVPMTELRQLGAFELELTRHEGAPERRLFARNVPTSESRLLGCSEEMFRRLYPPELHPVVQFVPDDGRGDGASGEGEAWPLLAMLLLMALLLESVLAWRFGRR